MESSDLTKVAILGAGRGGHALLDLLYHIPSIEIVGIADHDPAAPGLQRARELRIPVTTNVPDLIGNHGVSLILDVTGDQTWRPICMPTNLLPQTSSVDRPLGCCGN